VYSDCGEYSNQLLVLIGSVVLISPYIYTGPVYTDLNIIIGNVLYCVRIVVVNA